MADNTGEYTPTEEALRLAWALSKDDRDPKSREARYDLTAHTAQWEAIRDAAYAEFDRAIAAIRAEAWEEGREWAACAAEARSGESADCAAEAIRDNWNENPYRTGADHD